MVSVDSLADTAEATFLKDWPEYAGTAALDRLRASDYARLDQTKQVYLDYTGGSLYAASQIRAHASLIEGGAELSSYPARCLIGLERRTLPGETGVDVEAELETLLDRCRAADPQLEARRRTLQVREPFEISAGEPIVKAVREAATAQAGGATAAIAGASYWADSAFIAAAGIPTVLFGPGGQGAHEVEEWVSLADTEMVARTLVATARRMCG